MLIENYNAELDRWRRAKKPEDIDDFVTNDPTKIKWCSRLKQAFKQEMDAEFNKGRIRSALYRPYTRRLVYSDPILTHRRGLFPKSLPNEPAEKENRLIWTKSGTDWPFFALVSNHIVDVLPQGASECFPFYIYDEDGTNRRENITNWALEHFRENYSNEKITKWDIFYCVYGVLHHPEYRAKYAENLKRELPRIPLAKDFTGFSKAGKELARLHIEYESLEPWPLKFIETTAVAPGLSLAQAARKGGGIVAAVSGGGLRPPDGGGDTAATECFRSGEFTSPWRRKAASTKGRAPLSPTKCRPKGRRYDPALLSRGRQDAPGERPPLAQGERFLDAGRHSARNL